MRGQVVVFYALMIPVFLFFGGVGLDLGWYYLNVSRLQNAADASVIAGAKALASDKTNFNHYKYKALVDKYPSDMPDTTTNKTAGDIAAANYTLKNLSSDANYVQSEDGKTYTLKDNYTRGDNTITMTPGLYKDVQNNYYYVIGLSENIHHFFLGFLDDMNAGVVAVAMLKQHVIVPPSGEDVETTVDGTNILSEMYALANVSVIKNWEWQDFYSKDKVTYGNLPAEYADLKGTTVYPKEMYKAKFGGKEVYGTNGEKWNEYQDKTEDTVKKSNKTKTVHYKDGDHYRTETVLVQPTSPDGTTSSNAINFDSINLDFHPDLNYDFTEDWDIGYPTPGGRSLSSIQNGSRSSHAGYDLRIHSTFNFGVPYPVRNNRKNKDTNPEDVLYVRIESEPILPLPFVKNQQTKHTVFSTVRQIILNINQPNTGANDRPLMFFYTGPETFNKDYDYEDLDNVSHVRASQPVILNLNADAHVCLFAPHSPVVINGNNNKMQGFIIAKKFVRLTTEDDYDVREEDGKTRYFDKSNPNKEYFLKEDEHGNDLFIDEYGNVDTRDLPLNDSRYTRDPDYIAQLKNDSERSDYLEQLESDKEYLNHLKGVPAYANCSEMPERADKIDFEYFDDYEKIYKLTTFNLNSSSYYDSFQLESLKRNVYTYLDNYLTHRDNDPENNKPYSIDMFFTTIRSTWLD